MSAPNRAYVPGTDSIDITAPGGIEALLEFHRINFGDAVMRANDSGGEGDQDDTDTEDDDAGQSTADDDASDDQDDEGDSDGADALGDKGKQALTRMKEKLKTERTKRRQAEQERDAASATDEADKARREVESAALSKANNRIVRSEVKAAAKGVLADPNDAFRFINLDQFEVDDDGDVDEDEIAAAIADLVEKKPYLAAQGGKRFQGTGGGGARGRKSAEPTLDEQIAAAETAGNHRLAISLKRRKATDTSEQ
jgi:hypothetical protein